MDGINIVTTDNDFTNDLRNANIEGLNISYRCRFGNSIHGMKQIADEAINIVLNFSGPIAINLFSAWLYDRFKNRNASNITINNQAITNIDQINIVINNYQLEYEKIKDKAT